MSATSKSNAPRTLSTMEGFVCGGLAACIAVCVSNPMEVAKTRLQLQGELAKKGGIKVYANSLDVLKKTVHSEGIRGLQRGLGPAFIYQILLNGSRLSFYEPFRLSANNVLGWAPTDQVALTSVFAGATSGAVGAMLGNPLFLVKARMQARNSMAFSPANPVGTQHNYRNFAHGLSTIFKTDGIRGLVRGTDAAILRTAMGSSVQLPSYNLAKRTLVKNGVFEENSPWAFFVSSSISGACVLMVMQPADTALTRVYNQPTIIGPDGVARGALYKNPIDCLWKTFKAEGPRGWYKGSLAHFMRIAPHTIITLTANDIILNLYKDFKYGRQTTDDDL